jgi:hypothetical protein
MGRIVRLTERDLTRLVKRTITELDRSTYEKAADVAGEKGFNKLSDRFREHGKEFGLGQEKNNITMVVKHLGQEKEIELRMISLKKESNTSNTYTLETEDLDNGIKRDFEIGKYFDNMEFLLMGNHPSLPATRKDAKKVLRFFEDNGFSVSEYDPRSISYDDSGL